MFGLFKKKEEKKAAPAHNADSAMSRFGAQFAHEELDILAVTGNGGFGGTKDPESDLWQLCTTLTAWMEADSPNICTAETPLFAIGDDTLRAFLIQRLPRDFIIKCKARPGLDGKSLLLTNLPEPGFDPDLKAILEEQKKDITVEDETLGTFALNRSVGLFQSEVDWQDASVLLAFDKDDDRDGCLRTARTLLTDPAQWDANLRACAADQLLEQINELACEQEGGETFTREQFMESIELEMIEVHGDGTFQFWFNDGELYLGRSIRVGGALGGSSPEAHMEG